MTKIEMINMAIDLSYIQGKVQGYTGMVDCYDHLVNAIDTLVETIVDGENLFADHDGCEGCRYIRQEIDMSPCNMCKHSYKSHWTQKENE